MRTKEELVKIAVAGLAKRLQVPAESIIVVSVDAVTWPTPAMGMPTHGQFVAQVLSPGYRIRLEHAGKRYEYRATHSEVRPYR